jgi:fructosamine-3-kinase
MRQSPRRSFVCPSAFQNIYYICVAGQKLLEKLPELLGSVAVEPVLLHGDLWSGNVASDKEGRPVILDPACYCECTLVSRS